MHVCGFLTFKRQKSPAGKSNQRKISSKSGKLFSTILLAVLEQFLQPNANLPYFFDKFSPVASAIYAVFRSAGDSRVTKQNAKEMIPLQKRVLTRRCQIPGLCRAWGNVIFSSLVEVVRELLTDWE